MVYVLSIYSQKATVGVASLFDSGLGFQSTERSMKPRLDFVQCFANEHTEIGGVLLSQVLQAVLLQTRFETLRKTTQKTDRLVLTTCCKHLRASHMRGSKGVRRRRGEFSVSETDFVTGRLQVLQRLEWSDSQVLTSRPH